MKTQLRLWGRSLAVRIPKAITNELGMKPGEAVELAVTNGKLVISPISRPSSRLDQLLEGITDSNRHPEVDWGPPLGREGVD